MDDILTTKEMFSKNVLLGVKNSYILKNENKKQVPFQNIIPIDE